MRHYPVKRRRRTWPGIAFGVTLVVAGSRLTLQHHATTAAYSSLSEMVISSESAPATVTDLPSEETTVDIDWEALRHDNKDIAAWVTVQGTDISLPVLLPADGSMSYYLDHDFWRNPSPEGAPFLDHRCSADGIHRMAYGHHLSMGGQFSSLQTAYEQDMFDGIGACIWSTPAGGETALQPLCSLKVDMWYEAIQQFSFEGEQDVGNWLLDMASSSSARSVDWRTLATSAHSVVTLVTCSSNLSGQQWRTLVIFVEAEQEPPPQT